MSWRGLRHKGREILLPEEWNTVVDALDELHNSLVEIMDDLKPVNAKASISGSDNIEGLELVLDTGGRPNINIYYSLGGAGEIYIEISIDGSTWRTLDYITLASADSAVEIYTGIAYRYIRVRVPTTGISIEIEIAASR